MSVKLEVGDVVGVVAAFSEYDDGVLRINWNEAMKNCLGEQGEIVRFIGHKSIVVKCGGSEEWTWPISSVRKAEKTQPQPETDFQVGDEVEFLDDKNRCRTRHKSEFKLIRRAGEKQVHRCPGCGCVEGDLHTTKDCPVFLEQKGNQTKWDAAKKRIREETLAELLKTKLPLNPRVLPSVSGSELSWPDVKPGIELDKLPEDTSTNEDQRGDFKSNCVLNDAQSILGVTKAVLKNLGYANNSDRERIRKIIPEIRKKLETLEGRL